jgi:N-carbamoyl-L-amino-acid hydrolase
MTGTLAAKSDVAPGVALATRLFDRLARETTDPPGVSRASYGEGEGVAHALVGEPGERLGLEIATDAAGNLFLTLPGRDRSRSLIVGSHLDSVPHGGNYDGAAGVLAGLAVQASLRAAAQAPPLDLTVMAIRAEESTWFPASYIGSKAALGRLEPDLLDGVRRSDTGRTLAEHMAEEGFDPDAVRGGARLIEPARIAAYLEPHIEQGPVLIGAGIPIGIVTGIRGSFRYRSARCLGAYGHSGAVPRTYRRDAVAATAEFIAALNADWEGLEREGHDLAVTFGMLATDPVHHAFSKIAGETAFCLDVRSQSSETLERMRARVAALTSVIAARRNVEFALGPLTGSAPAMMDHDLLGRLRDVAADAGIETLTLSSGAGHDAAVFAQAGIPSAMIFIRNAHGSHNPKESMDMADFALAVDVLYRFVLGFPP